MVHHGSSWRVRRLSTQTLGDFREGGRDTQRSKCLRHISEWTMKGREIDLEQRDEYSDPL